MALTMLCSGKSIEAPVPFEMTVRWTRTAVGRTGYVVAFVHEDGRFEPMIRNWDLESICLHQTADSARTVARECVEKYRRQGLEVSYRQDLEN